MQNNNPNVFTIAPHSNFFKEVVISLLNGTLVENFQYNPYNPLSLASVTIYVPTKLAIQALRSEFFDIMCNKSTILPVIKPLGDILEENYIFNYDFLNSCELNQPISNIRRLLELAKLIILWRDRLPDAIRDIHPESPLNLPANPADAIWLAKNLAEIIDIIESEEKNWEELYSLNNEQYGAWWIIALDFLKIASNFWTKRLYELKASSAVNYRIELMRAESEYISNRKKNDTVIIAGSTGSMPATARLMSIVANDPNGAVVLPGLDLVMPEKIWQILTKKSNVNHSMHPQYLLAKIINFLKIKREDVKCLGTIKDDLNLRSKIISKSFLPSGNDDIHHNDVLMQDIENAFSNVALIEANNEREEATSIAIAMKLAMLKNKKKTALITADRNLARRVKLELTRFGIDIDISAGIPLSTTLQGSILITLLNAILKSNDPVAIAALIKHPMAKFGFTEKHLSRAKNALEFIALRGNKDRYNITKIKSVFINKISEQKYDKKSPNWRSRLSDEEKDLAALLADNIVKSTISLAKYSMNENNYSDTLDISDWVKLTVKCLENICFDEKRKLNDLWGGANGKALASFFHNIIETGSCIKANPIEWIDIISALISGETVKPENKKSSCLFIFGTLESRLLNFDTLILGGLNEGIWPSHIPKNPFLSRMMQNNLGLENAEKHIGQAAHDFEMASGKRNLIYSRSLQKNNVPTIASRWLQRLLVLGGKSFFDTLKKRGDQYINWARNLDVTTKQIITERPRPFPPLEMQPKTYSFSEVKLLISDPYAIYAKKILKLEFIPHFENEPDKKDLGIFFHEIITQLIQNKINKNTPKIVCAMEKIIDEYFKKANFPPHIDIIWRNRFHKIAHSFILYEEKRHRRQEDSPAIEKIFVNIPAKMEIKSIGVKLTGIADRIDILENGYADIIDYKTGNNPTKQMAKNLIDPQLSLEAAALKSGAFYQINCRKVAYLSYIRLKQGLEVDRITNNEICTDELSKKSLENFVEFISSLQNGTNPFISRLRLSEKSNIHSEYDHLARLEEWITDYDV
ncbi:double-strand break repair protein AddB [Candidatus Liberibacter americanus]|uniref:Inactivated superfamily I helicase n=1 Tax=Candidatus Liberibacter americanus str. Sao Paulo TaxID=1261131 RepID=U6B6L1_9HYPH|nr:double-strand break repair protein AddB [Candidatus Liberibacter americanus]AHA27506.1 Inactivated superfamily I helicase [Candidatus Liberibacter americanus str. Sao Paulo]EMS36532.1 double-strand break repair protein AddB [Candidatus Liberibacter americanus PW_SP]